MITKNIFDPKNKIIRISVVFENQDGEIIEAFLAEKGSLEQGMWVMERYIPHFYRDLKWDIQKVEKK